MDPDQTNAYLWHGYLPASNLPDWLWGELRRSAEYTAAYTLEAASVQLDAVFDRLCERFAGPHLVPISGGWDSRLILAALRERLGPEQIQAVSFGCPGQLDYELGAAIAHSLGVEHHALNLLDVQVRWSDLLASVHSSPWTYVPDGYFNALARETAAENGARTVWIGFLGDPLTGGHTSRTPTSPSEAQYCRHFSLSQQRSKRHPLAEPGYQPTYPPIPKAEDAPFTTLEWLDFGLRQRACIAPIVLPGSPWDQWSAAQGKDASGAQVVAPFCDPSWASYWLHAPRALHMSQRLYLDMAKYKFPKTFSLPSKYSFGFRPQRRLAQRAYRWQHRLRNIVHHRVPALSARNGAMDNYLDFQRAFRSRDDYIAVMEHALRVLQERDVTPWLDLACLWNEHLNARKDHSDGLRVLLGLALNLEAHT